MAFKKFTLRNGLRVIFAPQPASLAATVLILVEAGSEYETKRTNGVSHFLEHLTFKGTTKRPRVGMIAAELDSLGAEYNAFTTQEYTGYWAKAESRKLPQIVDIVSDLYLNPLFNKEEIEKERGVVIEEINMYEDTPARRVQEFFVSLLYGDQPAGWDVAGRKEVIRKLAREDFVKYRESHYMSQGTILIVAGAFPEDRVRAQLEELFEVLPRKARPAKPKTKESQRAPRTLLKYKDSDQSHLVLGVRAFNIFDQRRFALRVLADILGGGMSSRLFHRIREELGAAYYVRADAEFFLDHGYLEVGAGVDHGKIGTVMHAILDEFSRLRDEVVPARELQKAKDHLVGGLLLGLETSDELASFYGWQEVLTRKILRPEEVVATIQKVGAEEVRRVARQIFTNAKLNLAVIGPQRGPRPLKKILKL